jgi:hypothetical protein
LNRRGKYNKAKPPAPDPIAKPDVILRASDGTEMTAAQVNRLRWQHGLLTTLLRKHQLPLYDAILSTPRLEIRPIVCSRRWGKTMTTLICIEEIARKHPGSIIRMAFPTIKQAQTVIMPNWRKVLRTCPDDLRPVDRTNADEGGWIWPAHVGPCKCGDPQCVTSPGPSMFFFAGTDDNDQRERLRGSEANWFFGDEAGSQKELKYTVGDILSPQLDEVNGRGVLITTPPKGMDHEFVEFWDAGERSGLLVKKTIFDNSFNSPEKLRKLCEKANIPASGEAAADYTARIDAILAAQDDVQKALAAGCSSTWAREYLCGKVTDPTARVCPEFHEDLHVVQAQRPAFVDRYVLFDQGNYPDFFAILFCEFDFASGKLRVLREWLERHKNTREIVTAAKLKEIELWARGSGDWEDVAKSGPMAPRRFADDPRGVTQLDDMRDEPHRYSIIQADKSPGAAEQSRAVRYHLTRGAIEIDASCVRLISQMKDGIFKEAKDTGKQDFERSKTLGHLDAFSALALGVRCVNWDHNPIPAGVSQSNQNVFVNPAAPKPMTKTAKIARLLFRGAFDANL